jgi:hypothetical protein
MLLRTGKALSGIWGFRHEEIPMPGPYGFGYLITHAGRVTPAKEKKMATKTTAKKEKPYIDYKTAKVLARMYDFIIHANNERKCIYDKLNFMITSLRRLQELFTPLEDPSKWASGLEYDHIPDGILNISHDAWEAGLTHTLFEKLKDRKFWDRFTGWLGDPVLKEEIEDHYDFEDKPEQTA